MKCKTAFSWFQICCESECMMKLGFSVTEKMYLKPVLCHLLLSLTETAHASLIKKNSLYLVKL